jgi:cytochrome b561
MVQRRYSTVAMTFHWVIAALIIANVLLAWTFGSYLDSPDPASKALGGQLVGIHKSIGLTVLALSLFRLGWRLTHGFLPLPDRLPQWQKLLARFTHVGFYVLMIGVPLLGWALASADPRNFPLTWFGLFSVPKLPVEQSRALAEQLGGAHGAAATATLVLLALHVAGALKHLFVNRDGVAGRMIPGVPGPDMPARA